jgi:hypothetical protein
MAHAQLSPHAKDNRIQALRDKHAQIEHAIHEENKHPACSESAIRAWKLKKLHIKEELAELENMDSQNFPETAS